MGEKTRREIVAAAPRAGGELLTLEHIAAMHHCSIRHARDVLVKLENFPREAPTSTPRHRLWLHSEVQAFIHRKPVKAFKPERPERAERREKAERPVKADVVNAAALPKLAAVPAQRSTA